MSDGQLFELRLEATADVVRGCCGKAHEFGPCPYADQTGPVEVTGTHEEVLDEGSDS